MRIADLAAILAAFLAAAGALAQEAEGEAHPEEASPAVPPASELDALSARPDEDPFAEFDKKQVRRPLSVTVRALDKVTARTKDLAIDIGQTARFGSIEVLARHCDKRPPEEFPETTAYLEIFDRNLERARAAASVEVREAGAPRVDKAGRVVLPVTAPAPAPAPAGKDLPSALDPDRVFSGWMFASTPALNALEHPVYDVWVIDCKTVVVDN